MPLSINPANLMKFATYFSPIFIPSFLIVTSAIDWNLKGIMYVIGLMIAYSIGILMKFFFKKQFGEKYDRATIGPGGGIPPGWTNNAMPDFCSVFEGPFDHAAIGPTTMPSSVAIFHSFTILYIIMAVATNPHVPIGGIIFVLGLSINAITHLLLRKSMLCDKSQGIMLGVVIGAMLGVGWWAAIKSIDSSWLFFGDEKQKKCKLGKTKFKCTYT